MFQLRDLETRLNQDPQVRQAFYADPVAILHWDGLSLAPGAAAALRASIDRQRSATPRVAGASVAATTNAPMSVYAYE